MTEKQKQVDDCIRMRFPGLSERLEVQGDWVWLYVDKMHPGDDEALKRLGFKWSQKRYAYYHTCGVESKRGQKKQKKEVPDSEKARNIAQAVVARVRAGKGGS